MTHPTSPPPSPAPPAPPAAKPPGRSGLARFRVEITVVSFVLVFLVAALVPTWLLGGFERQKKELPRVQVGTTVENGEFRIKPIGAKLLDHHPNSSYDDKKNTAFLVMQLTVENLTKGPDYNLDRVLMMRGPVFTKDTPPDRIGLVSDNSSVSVLMPRVPTTVQAIWPIPDVHASKIGDTVDIHLMRQEFSEGYFSQREEWRVPRPWIVIVTPVVREAGA